MTKEDKPVANKAAKTDGEGIGAPRARRSEGDESMPSMPERRAHEVSEDGRPKGFVRQPFGATTFKLTAAAREGYHRHWFNEVLDRLDQAQRAGYTFVKEEGKRVKRVVGVAKGGGPLTAYLMEIPQQWYEEDMARTQRNVDEIDAAIRGGQIGNQEERYVPEKGIKIDYD